MSNEAPVYLSDILRAVRHHRAITMPLFFILAGVFSVYAIVAPPVYRATVLLAPTSSATEQTSAGAVISQLGAIAGLSGISAGGSSEREEAIAILKSHALAKQFIERNALLPVFFSKKWDSKAGKWLVDADKEPTLGEAFELFDEDIRKVQRSDDTGLITLTIDWSDRHLATKWAEQFVDLANQTLRERAVTESVTSLAFLKSELEHSEALAVQQALSSLIQAQLQKIAIAKGRTEYAFRVIDPAVTPDPDDYESPRRLAIALGGLLFGFIAVFFYGLLKVVTNRQQRY